jgi:hypothetical protein
MKQRLAPIVFNIKMRRIGADAESNEKVGGIDYERID